MADELPNRQSIRLVEYDYTGEGSYFITICVQHKQHRFGHIADGAMYVNEAGQMIEECILAIAGRFLGTMIDSYVVMPNHVHFILTLTSQSPNGNPGSDHRYVGAPPRGCPLSAHQGRECLNPDNGESIDDNPPTNARDDNAFAPNNIGGPVGPKAGTHEGAPLHIHDPNRGNDMVRNRQSVADIVGWFKASTTNYYIKGVKSGRHPVFDKRLWQRNFYEHIIRTESAYNQIDEYIQTNPQRWAEDRLR